MQPAVTGVAPPATVDPGNPCPAGATDKSVAISAVDVPNSVQGTSGQRRHEHQRQRFDHCGVRADAERSGRQDQGRDRAAGRCTSTRVTASTVNFTNQRAARPGQLQRRRARQVGGLVGCQRRLRPRADRRSRRARRRTSSTPTTSRSRLRSSPTSVATPPARSVCTERSWSTRPVRGSPTRRPGPRLTTGAIVDAHVPGKPGYRDDTLFLQDTDPQIGSDFMPYPIKVDGLTLVNYKNAGRRTDDFSGNRGDADAAGLRR